MTMPDAEIRYFPRVSSPGPPWRGAVGLAAALLAAGCAHRIPPCPPCEPEVRIVEVLVPVPVPCHVDQIPPPVEQLPTVAAHDTEATLQALLADLRAWRRAYEAQHIAAEACAVAPAPSP